MHIRKGPPKWIVKKGDKYLTELIVYIRSAVSQAMAVAHQSQTMNLFAAAVVAFELITRFVCWVLGEMRAAEIVLGFHLILSIFAAFGFHWAITSGRVPQHKSKAPPRAKTRYRDRRKHISSSTKKILGMQTMWLVRPLLLWIVFSQRPEELAQQFATEEGAYRI